MDSIIKIDVVDFGNGKGLEPVLNIKIRESEDVRDTLLKSLFQLAGNHLRIKFQSQETTTHNERLISANSHVLLIREEEDFDLLEAHKQAPPKPEESMQTFAVLNKNHISARYPLSFPRDTERLVNAIQRSQYGPSTGNKSENFIITIEVLHGSTSIQ